MDLPYYLTSARDQGAMLWAALTGRLHYLLALEKTRRGAVERKEVMSIDELRTRSLSGLDRVCGSNHSKWKGDWYHGQVFRFTHSQEGG